MASANNPEPAPIPNLRRASGEPCITASGVAHRDVSFRDPG